MTNNILPEKFLNLYQGEELLRFQSIEHIEKNKELLSHILKIENSMDMIDCFVNEHEDEDENKDKLTIQHLGILLFNGFASALKLLLSGYYQDSILIQRKLLEIIFLLDYFTIDNNLIKKWAESDKKARKKEFKLFDIRKKLDDRDGFTERKREKAYDLLCNLGAHPTVYGFRMLRRTNTKEANLGPFFDFTVMKATIEELTKHAIEANIVFNKLI